MSLNKFLAVALISRGYAMGLVRTPRICMRGGGERRGRDSTNFKGVVDAG